MRGAPLLGKIWGRGRAVGTGIMLCSEVLALWWELDLRQDVLNGALPSRPCCGCRMGLWGMPRLSQADRAAGNLLKLLKERRGFVTAGPRGCQRSHRCPSGMVFSVVIRDAELISSEQALGWKPRRCLLVLPHLLFLCVKLFLNVQSCSSLCSMGPSP